MGLDTGAPVVAAAVVTAAGGLLLAGVKALAWIVSGPRDRRRDLYGRAYQNAMAWLEMLYRVRRRANTEQAERELVERFHGLQEGIDHHRGWLSSESKYLARSYCRLVAAIKLETEPLIRTAWKTAGRRPSDRGPDGEAHPRVEAASLAFLTDVRLHLSLWPMIPRLYVAYRNREKTNNKTALPPASGNAQKEAASS